MSEFLIQSDETMASYPLRSMSFNDFMRFSKKNSNDTRGESNWSTITLSYLITLSFSGNEIVSIDPTAQNGISIKTVNSGLFNSMSILPLYFFDIIQRQQQDNRSTLLEFLSIFNETITLWRYYAFSYSKLPLQYEQNPNNNPFSTILHSITGSSHCANSLLSPDERLYYSNVLNKRIRNKTSIETTLSDYFSLPVQISPFQGKWIGIQQSDQTSLSENNKFNQLGINSIIGHRYWTLNSRIKIVIGPITLSQFKQFLPHSVNEIKLRAWLNELLPQTVDYKINLIVLRDDIPYTQLGENSASLGHTAWLKSKPSRIHCQQYCIGAKR